MRWSDKPKLSKPSAYLLPFLKTWEAKKFILLIRNKQLFHLFLKFQWITDLDLKAFTTKEESSSSQRCDQFLAAAISIALIAPDNLAWRAFPFPVFSAKHRRKSALEFLKVPPQAEVLIFAEPLVLHLIQRGRWGFQNTSFYWGSLWRVQCDIEFF